MSINSRNLQKHRLLVKTKVIKVLLAVLFLISLFHTEQSVHADVAPPPAPQLGGLEPFQYQNTNVQMVYERVEMEIQPFLFSGDGYSTPESRVNVIAYFTMHNMGNLPEAMQVIFPLESFSNCRMGYGGGNSYTNYFVQEDSFSAIIDGSIVPVKKVVTDHPNKVEGVCDQMTWAGFDVTFPVDGDVVIRVQYVMESTGVDLMQNIEYILETGAGWAGPIKRGYVIVKFPYAATVENVLSESTPGYQFLYNEFFWSFENLEPTNKDNIQVSIISPDTWQEILSLRRSLRENPLFPEKWLKLAQIYEYISTWHGTNVRNRYYYQKAPLTYEEGIASNPNSAFLYSSYAQYILNENYKYAEKIDPVIYTRVLSLVNQALALDSTDPMALQIVDSLKFQNPDLTFTPPPTIPATATSLFTATPSITPSATITPIPSETPAIVTVVQTRIVNSLVSTQTPELAATADQTRTQKESGSSTIIFGALLVFAVGVGSGFFLSRNQKE